MAFKPERVQAEAVRQAYPLLAQAGAELSREGVAFFDLRWLFVNEADPLYVDPCCHFNDRGNELLAEAVAAELAALLPTSVDGPRDASFSGRDVPRPVGPSATASPTPES